MEKQKKPKCHNCKHASKAFKIENKTYCQCLHEKRIEGLKNGELSTWDTLQSLYDSCENHEFKD